MIGIIIIYCIVSIYIISFGIYHFHVRKEDRHIAKENLDKAVCEAFDDGYKKVKGHDMVVCSVALSSTLTPTSTNTVKLQSKKKLDCRNGLRNIKGKREKYNEEARKQIQKHHDKKQIRAI